MWQRFTERARRVVFFAQEEAGRCNEHYVSTEHLLLGLVRENDGVAARILDRMGVSLDSIRSEIERHVTRGDSKLGSDMQLTPRSKKVIDLAYDEARQLGNNYIGTEHLLMALIREGDGLAGRVLAKLGVELVRTRGEVTALQDNVTTTGAGSQSTPTDQIKADIAHDEPGWRGRSLITLADVSRDQIFAVLDVAASLKALLKRGESPAFARPRTLALLFEKPSLRTRVSFEAGMAHMNGRAIYLAPGDVGLGTRESVPDVAGSLSRWVDVIAARVFSHSTVELLAEHSTVPVINALSDREHPIQMFADLLTLREHKGELGGSLKLAYVGDGNNVLNALLLACAKVGVNLSVACPPGYEPDPSYVEIAREICRSEGGSGAAIEIGSDPRETVRDADAIYTDVWTSMGQEAEKEARLRVFTPYQVNGKLLSHAKPDAIVLHCMPAHRGEEITADVMEAHSATILDGAENRMHTQKALLALIIGLGK